MKVNRGPVLIGFGLAVIAWLLDGVLDWLFFYEGNLLGLLLTQVPAHEIYVRLIIGALFVGFGFYAGRQLGRIDRARGREARRRQVLRAISSLNQMLYRETQRDQLLENACRTLVAERGYRSAWIVLLEEGRPIEPFYQAGFDAGLGGLEERLRTGVIPMCGERALASGCIEVFRSPASECTACPNCPGDERLGALAVRLEHGEEILGWMTVAIPAQFVEDEDEHSLLAEVAGDLARALKTIKAEKALRAIERRYEEIFSGSRDGIVIVNANGRIIDANQAFCAMLGYAPDELRAMENFYEITPEPWRAWEEQEIWRNRLLTRGYSGLYEKEYIRKDGSVFPVELQSYAVLGDDGRPAYLWGLARDITARRRAEHELHQQKENLQTTLESIGDGVLATGGDGRVTWMNPVAERLTGWSAEEARGRLLDEVFVIVNEETRATVESPARKVLHEGVVVGLANHTVLISKDGREIPIADSGAPIRSEAGEITGVVLVFSEQTAERAARRALEESEARFRLSLENAPLPVMVHREDGVVISINRAWTAITGYVLEEIPTTEVWARKAYGDAAPQVLRDIEALHQARGPVREGGFPVLTKTGETRNWEFSSAPIGRSPGGPGLVVSMAMDVTEQQQAAEERERLQAQLAQSQKMESVGRLAGGVAHDFNNMLSVILGNTELALERQAPDDPLYEDLTEIANAAHRSADLTRQLLAFARKQTVAPKIIDLNETVENTLAMMRRLIGEHIDLEWSPKAGVWPVRIDPSQIDQILANLAVNARDAIGESGTIAIETANVTLEPADCAAYTEARPGEFVLLSVNDDGCGMDHNTLSQVFDPFFTTKQLGEGTGLGLATVYGIVKQNAGFVHVASEPGRMTTVQIYLPRHASEEAPASKGQAARTGSGGGEKILLVEDEAMLLDLGRRMLEGMNYQVVTACSPSEALRIAEENPSSIDLLMTDIVMPEMNGRDLARKLTAVHPGLRCLFMSGYTANVIAHHNVLDENVNFIQKPFTTKDLSRAIRGALESGPEGAGVAEPRVSRGGQEPQAPGEATAQAVSGQEDSSSGGGNPELGGS